MWLEWLCLPLAFALAALLVWVVWIVPDDDEAGR